MKIRGSVVSALLGCALLAGCGGGSGRYAGTDLYVSGSGPSGQLNGGDPVTFHMTVTNGGDYDAANVTIRNATSQISAPSVNITCAASGGASCPATTGTSMTVPLLPKGGVLAFTITATVNAGASGSVSDTMSASSDSTESNGANNTLTVSAPTVSNDVSVTGTAPPGPLVQGEAIYTMVVTNAGPDTAADVTLTTSVSADLAFDPAGVSCVAAAGASAPVAQSDGSLRVPELPLGGTLTCSVPVTLQPGTNGFAIVTMVATAAGDARPSNNTGTASVNATLVNDLSVVATAPAGPLTTPSATFTMTVSNLGPAAATAVVLTNTLGPNLTLAQPISCVPGGGAAAALLQPDGTLLSALIPVNGQLVCSVPVTVAAGNTGNVYDTLTASNCCDVRAGNNSATASVATTLSNNVSVSANSSAASVPGGGSTTFSFTVANSGPSTAFNVGLSNVLGPNLTLQAPISCIADGSAVVPVAVGGVLTSAAIPAGAALTCSVPVTVTAGANGNVSSTFTATAANDQRSGDNSATAVTLAVSSDLGVSQTGATEVAAGTPATFKGYVVNPRGQGTANNLTIRWTPAVPSGSAVTFEAPTCTATGGATCPATLGTTMTVPSLLPGGQLQFTFVADTTAADRGAVSSQLAVTSDADVNASNNTATTTTTVVDARNGNYLVFGADGTPDVSLSITFDDAGGSGRYTLTDSGGRSAQFGFALEAASGDYVVNGNRRFRVADDMLVGAEDFGAGVVPYVAARNFAATISGAAGTYNLGTRDIAAGGVATTHAGTAVISGNTLSICDSDTPVTPVRNCVAAGARKDYQNLTISGNVISGKTASGEVYSFSIAGTGAVKVLLSARRLDDGSHQLRIGLPESTAGLTYGPALRGASSNGDWLAVQLSNAASPPTYSASGAHTAYADLPLSAVNSGGPFAMLINAAPTGLYVMQASPLVLAVGGSGTPTTGLLQVSVP